MLPCTGGLARYSASKNALSSARPSLYTRVLRYCCGARIAVSKSSGRSVDAFGLDDAESVEVRIGSRYGASGT